MNRILFYPIYHPILSLIPKSRSPLIGDPYVHFRLAVDIVNIPLNPFVAHLDLLAQTNPKQTLKTPSNQEQV